MVNPLPPLPTVETFLSDLLGRQVAVSTERSFEPGPSTPVSVAAFKTSEGELTAICIFDLNMANFAGASFSMIPAGMAKNHVKSKQVPENIQENLDEIFNISARLFDSPDIPEVHFSGAYPLKTSLPAELVNGFKKTRKRIDMKVEIKGYGAGRMSLLRAA
jgi:hypothetical protein